MAATHELIGASHPPIIYYHEPLETPGDSRCPSFSRLKMKPWNASCGEGPAVTPPNHNSTDMKAMHSTRKLCLYLFSVCKFYIELARQAPPLCKANHPIFLDHFKIYYFESGYEGLQRNRGMRRVNRRSIPKRSTNHPIIQQAL